MIDFEVEGDRWENWKCHGFLTDELLAIAFACERFHAFVYPLAVFVETILWRHGWDGFRYATVEGRWTGVFVAHDWIGMVLRSMPGLLLMLTKVQMNLKKHCET